MESANTESKESGLVSIVQDNIRKFDIIFVPSSYIRTMRGEMKEIERSGYGPVHIIDRLKNYTLASMLEAVRLTSYAFLANEYLIG